MTIQLSEIVQHLRSTAIAHNESALTDGQLLSRFIENRDQAAIGALVRRHGPMVWGVCRRMLRHHHDAEDAFQATFLVLVRKALSIRQKDAVGNWLYGVAQQTARKARALLSKRRTREMQGMDGPEPQATDDVAWHDVELVLDEELARLPDRYRAPIVLCDLEGKSYKEAARQLRCPEGTLAARLSRGRTMLAGRLAARGLAVVAAGVMAEFMHNALSASVPASALATTIQAAHLFARGQGVAEGVISAKVTALTEGVLKAMLLKKLQTAMVLLLVTLGGLVVSGMLLQSRAADPPQRSETPPPPRQDEKSTTDKSDKSNQDLPTRSGREVVSAFEHNRARVDEDYLTKKMRVSGKMYRVERVGGSGSLFGGLGSIKESDDQYYYLTLSAEPKDDKKPEGAARTESELPLALVFPASARKQLAELDRGQQVTIEGTCEGKKGPLGQYMGHYVIFTACKVVKK
jgi:RNA polymerase sigma factor (sigma-70 family)